MTPITPDPCRAVDGPPGDRVSGPVPPRSPVPPLPDARPTARPAWLPDDARLYLAHVEDGVPLRQLARAEGCHASTILRRVRRTETRREDPLVDAALNRLVRRPVDDSQMPPAYSSPDAAAPSCPARASSALPPPRPARRIRRS